MATSPQNCSKRSSSAIASPEVSPLNQDPPGVPLGSPPGALSMSAIGDGWGLGLPAAEVGGPPNGMRVSVRASKFLMGSGKETSIATLPYNCRRKASTSGHNCAPASCSRAAAGVPRPNSWAQVLPQ